MVEENAETPNAKKEPIAKSLEGIGALSPEGEDRLSVEGIGALRPSPVAGVSGEGTQDTPEPSDQSPSTPAQQDSADVSKESGSE